MNPHSDAPELEQFNSDASFGTGRHVQRPDTDQLKTSEPPGGTTGEISFGPFRLLPARFLLLEDDKPVPLGSRALHILLALLERPGQFCIAPRAA
jgi:DNA-binding response OmpR family regulator